MANKSRRVKSVHHALTLLQYVCSHDGHQGVSLSELSHLVGLSKPSVYNLLYTLQEFRLVFRDPQNGLYKPGSGLLWLAHQARERFELRSVAFPELEKLWEEVNETVHLAILEDGEIVYLEKRESRRTVRMYSGVGKRAPVHCTALGKAILAYLPQQERSFILAQKGLRRFTPNTITTLEAFENECKKVRERGYALDLGEHEMDIRCVAAPVFDHAGYPIAAISVAIPAFRADQERLENIAPKVLEAARAVSTKLGYTQGGAKCGR